MTGMRAGMSAHHVVLPVLWTRSRSQVTAAASHPLLPGDRTSFGQPDGIFAATKAARTWRRR
jgi:hypothetical protein